MEKRTQASIDEIFKRHSADEARSNEQAERIKREYDAFIASYHKWVEEVGHPVAKEFGEALKARGADYVLKFEADESDGSHEPSLTMALMGVSPSSPTNVEKAAKITILADGPKRVLRYSESGAVKKDLKTGRNADFSFTIERGTRIALESWLVDTLDRCI